MIGQYTTQQWLLYFYVYCFLGWIFESCYVSFRKKQWVNRGFLHGPFLPIYGSGAVMMLFVSEPFKDNLILTYFAGVVGATLLELVTGAAMEALLKVRYWDYSNQKFNYKGYICLSSSVAWGFLTILMNEVFHPAVERMDEIGKEIELRLAKMREMAELPRLPEHQKLEMLDMKERIGKLKERNFRLKRKGTGNVRMLIKGNPTMVSPKYTDAFNQLKGYLADFEEKRKGKK